MARLLLLLLSPFFAYSVFAQEDTLQILMNAGIEMHDKGEYAEAIKRYDAIIGMDENNYLAYYEKSLSLLKFAKYQDCADLCKLMLKKFPEGKDNAKLYVNYGSAMDAMDDPKEALKIYEKGIKKYPDSYLLHFNHGITNYLQKNYEDAANDFKTSASLNPGHASSHQYLAYSVYDKNKLAAAMSLATFLVIEPEGNRAAKNLKILLAILGSNVEKKDDKTINITMSPSALKLTKKGEDDFHLSEMMLSMRAALDYSDEYKDLTPAQKLKNKLEILAEANGGSKKGFFSTFYIPFLSGIKESGYMETASYLAYSSMADPVNKKWLEDNSEKVTDFYKWVGSYKW